MLEKIRMTTRQEYLQGGATSSTSSVRASDRLMRELRDIYRSLNFKEGGCGLSVLLYRHGDVIVTKVCTPWS